MTRSDEVIPWLYLLPALIIASSFFIFPLIYSFNESLYSTTMYKLGDFVGFENYLDLIIKDEIFQSSITYALFYLVVTTSIELVLGIGLAHLFSAKLFGINKIRALLIVPLMMTPIVASFSWKLMYHPMGGILNTVFLPLLGQKPMLWLSTPLSAQLAIMLCDIWKYTAFTTFIFIAGLASINPDLVDSARVDGASKLQRFRHITLPILRPLIIIACIFTIMRPFYIFEFIYVITQGGPGFSTYLPSFTVYRFAFFFLKTSLGAAASFVILGVVLVVSFFLIKKGEEYLGV